MLYCTWEKVPYPGPPFDCGQRPIAPYLFLAERSWVHLSGSVYVGLYLFLANFWLTTTWYCVPIYKRLNLTAEPKMALRQNTIPANSPFFYWTLTAVCRTLVRMIISMIYVATFPVRAVRAVGKFVEVGTHVGWNMTKGYMFPAVPLFLGKRAVRRYPSTGSQPSSAKQMSQILKRHIKKAGELVELSTHSFLPGGAVSRALAGDSASTFMQRAF